MSTSNGDYDDDCIIINDNDPQNFWTHPESEGLFDSVNFDVDSVLIVGDADMSWLSPPSEFECRLDLVHATLLKDKKVMYIYPNEKNFRLCWKILGTNVDFSMTKGQIL